MKIFTLLVKRKKCSTHRNRVCPAYPIQRQSFVDGRWNKNIIDNNTGSRSQYRLYNYSYCKSRYCKGDKLP